MQPNSHERALPITASGGFVRAAFCRLRNARPLFYKIDFTCNDCNGLKKKKKPKPVWIETLHNDTNVNRSAGETTVLTVHPGGGGNAFKMDSVVKYVGCPCVSTKRQASFQGTSGNFALKTKIV